MSMTHEAAPVIPAHPEWCAGPTGNDHHCPSDPYHRGDTCHVDVQVYEVGFAASLVQMDDHGPHGREIGVPRIELSVTNRETRDFVFCHMDVDEVRRVIGMLSHVVRELETVHDLAGTARGGEFALGWKP